MTPDLFGPDAGDGADGGLSAPRGPRFGEPGPSPRGYLGQDEGQAGGRFVVQGWCPGALRPMMSGDGLVVRVRPLAGRLSATQAAGIAAAARAYGNGLIDLSGRANVQLRGVTPDSHPPLIADLRALGLIDADAAAEARRNVLVTPFADATTDALAAALVEALRDGPELPGKFGFAVDSGPAPVMTATPADIRLERDAGGGLILRADGMALGAPVGMAEAPSRALDMARWFIAAGGVSGGRGRMGALISRGITPPGILSGTVAPAAPAAPPGPGAVTQGLLVAFDFGQLEAETLAALAVLGDLRVTPWRMLLVEGVDRLPDGIAGAVTRADDPLLRVRACTGAPGCLQARAEVRGAARRLAAVAGRVGLLHVSGCAKGCAHPAAADVTLVATGDGFDLIRGGSAQDAPSRRGLSLQEILDEGLL